MRIEAVGRACFPIVQINRKRTPLISRPSGNNPLGTANHGRMYNSKLESHFIFVFRKILQLATLQIAAEEEKHGRLLIT